MVTIFIDNLGQEHNRIELAPEMIVRRASDAGNHTQTDLLCFEIQWSELKRYIRTTTSTV